ncbi:SusC/RagA family TonB-linked outer membrane protein [Flavobacterium gawalongense]|uniref:TonB-dependent receptor n=1 Tax=Flavobacterium gawalongense TaxID=2594432 RepID=A0A553BYW5_9FLAO|nr:TonB-dependent receptor [Flavobacterium gawalongense]TRX13424.1 TonB-dependent receptor [Flavobacterium gawalongense]TRX15645.1 TonB-dependent receptor [Flavobacterium gawalongense]TRX31483.1 TonB-dependent receptor [Flavobacterium gawalongense]
MKITSFDRTKFALFLLIFLVTPFIMMAQDRKIKLSGKVVDETNMPLPGATVMLKKSSLSVITDSTGNFDLLVSEQNPVFIVSYMGYISKEVKPKGNAFLDIKLQLESTTLNNVVIIGYGEVKSKDLTGSISTIKLADLSKQPVANVGDAIQGRAAGVQVITSGKPGDNPTFRIRGTGTIGNNDPLIVVDGMPLNGGLNQVNMNDVESLQILKDASSTAIYGSRGSNGVVIITTKRGTLGKSSLSFDVSTGISEATDVLQVLNASQFASLHNDILNNADLTPNPDFQNPASLGVGTNWVDAFFRTGIQNNYTLSYSTGNEKSKVYTSLNIFDQKGIIINTDYKRYIFQFNSDTKISDNLKFGNSLKLNHDIKSQGDYSIQNALLSLPTQPIYRANGNFSGPIGQAIYSGDVDNPIGKATIIDNSTKGYNIQGNLFGEVTFLKNFKFKTIAGAEANFWKSRTWAPTYSWDTKVGQNAFLSESSNQSITLLFDNTLTFNKKFDNGLNVTGVIGTSAQQNKFEFISGSIQNFPSESTQTLNNGISQSSLHGSGSEWAIFSTFARANFDYKSKYYATATVRRDGSSRFGVGNKYGTFPSASLAWRISNEDFFKSKSVNDLKLRLGYGITGNQEIGNYSFSSNYNTYLYNFNGSYVSAAVPSVLPNSNVKWEAQEQYNIGVDASLFNERVNITLDAYVKNTNDMLVPQSVPVTSGYSDIFVPYINAGKIQNKGIELVINTKNIQKDKFSWNSDFVFSINRNKVIDLNGDAPLITGGLGLNYNISRIQEEYPINVFYGFVQEGIFQSQAAVDNHAVQVQGTSSSNSTSAGDVRFKDLNNDGLITDADRTFIGNPNPDFAASLNNTFTYGDFSLSVYLQGVYGNDVFNANRLYNEAMSITTNQSTAVLGRWTGPGTGNSMPRAIYGDPNNNNRASSRYIEDGSYMRIKNVTLSYKIPTDSMKKKFFDYAKVYLSGQNLLTFTKYKGFDPEVSTNGIDNNIYPVTRIVSLGLNVGF